MKKDIRSQVSGAQQVLPGCLEEACPREHAPLCSDTSAPPEVVPQPPSASGGADDLDLAFVQRFAPGSIIVSQASASDLEALQARIDAKSARRSTPPRRSARDSALLDAWGDWLAPRFANGSSVHFTGTYSDEYGYSHGLMLVRNVIKDFQAFRGVLERYKLPSSPGCIGVEYHPQTHRAILHLHALLGGEWDAGSRRELVTLWQTYRGFARATEVVTREDCVRYAAKHLLKQGDTDAFDFWAQPTRPSRYLFRHEVRALKAEGLWP